MATARHWRDDKAGRFYLAIALLASAAVAIGFSTTYFLPLAGGTFAGPIAAHVHGLLFIAWTALMLSQPLLVRLRRTPLHRTIGWIALPLAPAMAASGLAVGVYAVRRDLAAGVGDLAYSQMVGVATTMAIFLAFVAIAIALRRRPDWHKRMMVLATIAIIWPAWFRFRHLLPFVPRPDVLLAVLLSDSLVAIAMLRDRLRFGRVHPVYLVFGLFLIAEHVAEVLAFDTPAWRAAARAIFEALTAMSL